MTQGARGRHVLTSISRESAWVTPQPSRLTEYTSDKTTLNNPILGPGVVSLARRAKGQGFRKLKPSPLQHPGAP